VTLADVLLAAAGQAGVAAEPAGDGAAGMIWAFGGQPFATLDATGSTASFRLDTDLAAAARRTPDTAASSRGAEWVAFTPRNLDGHAADRASAWFAAAGRRAVG